MRGQREGGAPDSAWGIPGAKASQELSQEEEQSWPGEGDFGGVFPGRESMVCRVLGTLQGHFILLLYSSAPQGKQHSVKYLFFTD